MITSSIGGDGLWSLPIQCEWPIQLPSRRPEEGPPGERRILRVPVTNNLEVVGRRTGDRP